MSVHHPPAVYPQAHHSSVNGSRHRVTKLFFVAVAFLLFLGLSCSKDDAVKVLMAHSPPMSEETARRIVTDDDDAFQRYAESAGFETIRAAFAHLVVSFNDMSVEVYDRDAATIFYGMDRLSRALEVVFNNPEFRVTYERMSTRDRDQLLQSRRLLGRINQLVRDAKPPIDDERAELQKILGEVLTLDDKNGYARTNIALAQLLAQHGRADEAANHLHKALHYFRSKRNHYMACQLLGMLGVSAGGDSTLIHYNEALNIATEHDLPLHITRALMFLGAYYSQRGRLALAHDYYSRALDACENLKLGEDRIRFLATMMNVYARYELWEMVGRLLARARTEKETGGHRGMHDNTMDVMEARYLAATGRVRDAVDVYWRVEARLAVGKFPMVHLESFERFSTTLVAYGYAREAMPVIGKGLNEAIARDHPRIKARLWIAKAEAEFALGEYDASRSSLQSFDAISRDGLGEHAYEWATRDALLCRQQLAAGDTAGAYETAHDGLVELERQLRDLDASLEPYFTLSRARALKATVAELVANDARLACGLELYWSGLGRVIGDSSAPPSLSTAQVAKRASLEALLRPFASRAVKAAKKTKSMLVVYDTDSDPPVRYEIEEKVERYTLPMDTQSLRELCERTSSLMAAPPGGGNVGDHLMEASHALARTLLPARCFTESMQNQNYRIRHNGYLGAVPFEALNLSGPTVYLPWIERADVSYFRSLDDERAEANAERGLAVAASAANHASGTVYLRELQYVDVETAAVAEAYPQTTLLRGASATLPSVVSGLSEASLFYAATHAVRHRTIPYLTMLVLSAGDSLAGNPPYLDFGTIRGIALQQCELAVLSACATGAPFVGDKVSVPGLGAAFLDAGAGAVVQTLWDVQDRDAARVMTDFIREMGSDVNSAGAALNHAKRSAMRGSSGARHPFYWAAFVYTENLR